MNKIDIDKPILTSMLDDDLYKITQGSVAFHLFPKAVVTYEFFNRGKTKFPPGFANALQYQIHHMSKLVLTPDEFDWLCEIPYLRTTYVEWLRGYRMNPGEVDVSMDCDGQLYIKIEGPWYRTIYWEVKLMAVISELYFKMIGAEMSPDWKDRIENKGLKLQTNGCHWMDFGTRRRFSFEVQDALVGQMKYFRGFLGTSNPYLAFKHNVKPNGTFAHESLMAMSAFYGDIYTANKMWMKHWSEHFEGNVGTALTDTFTTSVFLKTFSSYEARLFDGVRHDSGDPYKWGDNMLRHYGSLGIPTSNKRLVFSDALTTDKYIALDKYFRKNAQPIGGIGTHFSNDCGATPLNIVIKMTSASFGYGRKDVIKLSDDISKATGNPELIKETIQKLKIM